MIKINDQVEIIDKITIEKVKKFAEVSGDNNPIHVDEEYAKKSIFRKRIAHGMLGASFISRLIGTQLPGYGTIYMKQDLNFIKPVYLNDEIKTIIRVKDIDYVKGNITLKTTCINQNQEIVIDGEALVRNKEALK